MERAFVAGATGYTGREVVTTLRRQGVPTVAHIHPGSAALERMGARFRELGAEVDDTPWQVGPLAQSLARWRPSWVFSLLGTTRRRARREGLSAAAAYQRVDYGLTVLLIDSTVAAGLRPRFLYLSAVGVRPGSGNAYLEARARVEATLTASGLAWTIARPSFITGPDREESRPAERLAATAGDALLALAGGLGARRLRDRYRSIRAAGLAAALVAAALDPGTEGRVIEAEELHALARSRGPS